MAIDITEFTSSSTYQGLTLSSSLEDLGGLDDLVATSQGLASVSSNGTDLVALSAQALIDEAGDITGLDGDIDLESIVADLSPAALSGLLDSTNDSAVLSAFFGSTDTDALLTSVVSSSTSG
jgi:hypothetical protein